MPHTPLVIVVDDHEDSCAMYALMLGSAGYEIATVATAEEALGLAQQRRPDAVVADVRLPGASGLDLTRQLRADDRTRNTAILLLTGDALARERGTAAGSDRFLLKPFPLHALAAEIRAALAARASVVAETHGRSAAVTVGTWPPPSAESPHPIMAAQK